MNGIDFIGFARLSTLSHNNHFTLVNLRQGMIARQKPQQSLTAEGLFITKVKLGSTCPQYKSTTAL